MIKERINFSVDNETVRGTLFRNEKLEGQVPGVILAHGMTSNEINYGPLAEDLANNDIIGMTINLRAHGDSDGDFSKMTVAAAVNDLLVAYDYLVSTGLVDPKRIGLSGTSVSAVLVALAARKRDVKSIVMRVPAVYTEEMMHYSFEQTMLNEADMFGKITNPEDTPAVEAIANFEGKLLVILSENDQILSARLTESYFKEATAASKRQIAIIPDATHNLSNPEWRTQYKDLLVNWFVKTL
jgi:hypothetical protein